ncbi:hypothetical protein ES332_A05G149400v1 [Gossypium tomentosum]|uniref:Uncharacterized protein n=1 Tax=Gossypium tomentosum TaxID=34277 RepID=A0A5D2QET6_GOSTO|nr:hypothetical protein ES332_A05G149400v1 [Gossypium tomentosum]
MYLPLVILSLSKTTTLNGVNSMWGDLHVRFLGGYGPRVGCINPTRGTEKLIDESCCGFVITLRMPCATAKDGDCIMELFFCSSRKHLMIK